MQSVYVSRLTNHVHAEITIAALKAGKHNWIIRNEKKPMATKLKDCQMMVDTAEQMSKKLMIGQNQRFAKAHAEAKKLIERGDIGSVLTFKTTFGHGGPETWSVDAGRKTGSLIRRELQWEQWQILEYIRQT